MEEVLFGRLLATEEYESLTSDITNINDKCECGVPLGEGENIADDLYQCLGCGKITAVAGE